MPLEIELTLEAGAGKRAKLNGAPLRAAEQLRSETATLVFTPDRLGVVKGAPAARRAYFDRALGRLTPARAQLPAEYGAAVAQRNASLRRVAGGFSTRDALAPWTEQVADARDASSSPRASETLALLGAAVRRARRRARASRTRELRYDGRAADGRRRSTRGSTATSSAASPASARTSTTSSSPPARASCGASARRASSGSPCSRSCSPRRS